MKILSDFLKRSNCISVTADKFDYDTYLLPSIPKLTRDKMPQIADDDFDKTVKALEADGIKETMMRLKDLKPTQCEINVDKVKSKVKNIDINTLKFICSKTNQIADGHHGHVAGLLIDPNAEVKVFKSKLPTAELIDKINDLKHTTNNEI